MPANVPSCSPKPVIKTPHSPQLSQLPLSDLLKEKKARNIVILYLILHQKTARNSLKCHRQTARRIGRLQCAIRKLVDSCKYVRELNKDTQPKSTHIIYTTNHESVECVDTAAFLLLNVFSRDSLPLLCVIYWDAPDEFKLQMSLEMKYVS